MSCARVPTAIMLAFAVAAAPAIVQAQGVFRDRVVFGGDAVVGTGEVVESVVVFGGDAVVDGRVLGNVVSMGGDVRLGPGADVVGSVTSLGGRVDAAPGARFDVDTMPLAQHIRRFGLGRFLEEVGRQVVAHGLLFLLALLLMGLAPERLGAMQVAIVRDPVKTGALGLLGYVLSIVAIALLAITILGIPAAIALALVLPIATYLGLAASATVIGAALPIARLRDRPVQQLAAGVLVLLIASIVPYVGTLVVAVASCLGLGALMRTRFRTSPPFELVGRGPAIAEGPYRTSAL